MDKVQRARRLRKDQTEAEKKLWYVIRNRQHCGQKFRRQYPLAGYIVDFCCLEQWLVVDVDGGQHFDNRKDKLPDQALERLGFRTLRFWNHDVLQNIKGVLELTEQALKFPHPDPLPKGEGT